MQLIFQPKFFDFYRLIMYFPHMDSDQKINLKDLSLPELEELALKLGKKKYAGRQLFKWLFKHGIEDFSLMTDLGKSFREQLDKQCRVQSLRAVEKVRSDDDTVKTVWQTPDKLHIESVLIPEENRLTLCISSQAGCPIGCGFCATGLYGFHRSLTAGEIFDQYLLTAGTLVKGTKITNLVFMGMGEPFLNYENVIKACDILTSQLGAGLSAKKITISTVGLVKGIYRLADEDPRFKLAVSLHSAVEENRQKLIPVAQKNPLSSLKEACRYYAEKSGARITFEYLLIKNINDNPAEAKALATFVRNIPCKVNLIIYNEIEGVDYRRPDEPTVAAFRDYLYPRAPAVTVRKSRGADIRAACGQLAGKKNN